MTLDPDTCWRAMIARDARFDGVFFVAVRTTGIYCRPICPVRTPARDRCAFFRHAAAAEKAGYRACLRCRPELAPGHGPVDAIDRLVAAAVARIDAGGSVERVAADLRVTSRHLRRALRAEIGVSPIELLQSRRIALAKQLLQDTDLPIGQIAFASGFASVRRFNASFRARLARAPSQLRRGAAPPRSGAIALRLDYRPPLDGAALLGFLAGRATPGVEAVDDAGYRRTIAIGDATGWISARITETALRVEISAGLVGALLPIRARLRRLFDLDAHPHVIAERLARDPRLRGCVRARPGLRVPGAFDGFEIAVRSILGQQVSVRAATTLCGRLARELGQPFVGDADTPADLSRVFPPPHVVRDAGPERIAALGIPLTRARTLVAIAGAIADGTIDLNPSAAIEATLTGLRAIPGIGDWTAQYIAMRALAWPDAFPAGDLVLRRALGNVDAATAEALSDRWRPWRSYAAIHLWTKTAGAPR